MTTQNSYRYTVFFSPIPDFTGLLTKPERPWTVGGTGQTCAVLAKALARRGDTEVILLLQKEPDYKVDIPSIKIRVIRPTISKGLPYISRFTNRRIEKENFGYAGQCPIMFFSTYPPSGLIQRIRAQSIPMVLWINGDSLTDESDLIPALSRREYNRYIEFSEAIIVQNNYQKQTLEQFHGRKAALMIPCIVESPLSNMESSDCTYNLGYKPELLWVARCSGVKRPWVLIQLAQLLPELNIIAIMPRTVDEQFDRTIRHDLSRCPNVTVIDGMPHEKVLNLYREDTIVINTSASEGIPNTFIEAASANRPFISLELDLGGLLDDGSDNKSLGLCAYGDINLMCRQIRELAADPERRLRIGHTAHDYVYEQWNADKVAAELARFMDTLPIN